MQKMFTIGDAIIVTYPPTGGHALYRNKSFNAFYVSDYHIPYTLVRKEDALVLWSEDDKNGEDSLTTARISKKYIKGDKSRSNASKEYILEHSKNKNEIKKQLQIEKNVKTQPQYPKYRKRKKKKGNYTYCAPNKKTNQVETPEKKPRDTTQRLAKLKANNEIKNMRLDELKANEELYSEIKANVESYNIPGIAARFAKDGLLDKTHFYKLKELNRKRRRERNGKKRRKQTGKKKKLDNQVASSSSALGTTITTPKKKIDNAYCMLCNVRGAKSTDDPALYLCEHKDNDGEYCCYNAMHVYCIPNGFVEGSEWYCPIHAKLNNADKDKVLEIKLTYDQNYDLVYRKLILGQGWIPATNSDIKEYMSKPENMEKLISRTTRNEIFLKAKTFQLSSLPHIKQTEYSFLNGTKFGITQFNGLFTEVEMKEIETYVDRMIGKLNPESNTLDISSSCKRKKIFLGYRYAYGKEKNNKKEIDEIFDDVKQISSFPLLKKVINKITSETGIQIKPDQMVLNFYDGKHAKLSSHVDSKDLFLRPIISLRLFSSAKLYFNRAGQGMVKKQSTIVVKQKRGTVTLMDSIAANEFTHCICDDSIQSKSVSILIRQVTETSKQRMKQRQQAIENDNTNGGGGGRVPELSEVQKTINIGLEKTKRRIATRHLAIRQLYECEKGCGFKSSWTRVAKHEETCTRGTKKTFIISFKGTGDIGLKLKPINGKVAVVEVCSKDVDSKIKVGMYLNKINHIQVPYMIYEHQFKEVIDQLKKFRTKGNLVITFELP